MIRRRRIAPAVVAALAVGAVATSFAAGVVAASIEQKAGAPAAFIRVNQIGYPASASKRAYLLSAVPQQGATFKVRRRSDSAAVLTGTVGPPSGRWSARFRYVYALDFDSLATPGSFTIAVTGASPASSPPFTVDASQGLYGQALHNTLSFYETERDGPNFIRSPLRTAPAHLNDRSARVYLTPRTDSDGAFKGDLSPLRGQIDASGGWWDAGDYLKFVETTSYTVGLLLAGVRDFPATMGPAATASDFTAEAKFGLQWLLRMWDDRTRTLYYQVGIGDGNAKTASDHDIWRLPQADDHYGAGRRTDRYIRRRPVFRAAPPGSKVSPNLAGRDAAAFGLCAQVFATADPRLAARCMRAGEHIFDLADTSPRGRLLTVIPFDFYPETEWRDDMELGAVELAGALARNQAPAALPHRGIAYYLGQAVHLARAFIAKRVSIDTLNLYDVSGFAHWELYRALSAPGVSPALAGARAALLADLRHQLNVAAKVAAKDPFGFGFPWNTYDTASHGLGLAVMASEIANLTGNPADRQLASRWLGNVLGANAWGISLVIGDGTTFPHCPQHQVANIVGSLDGTGAVLAGGVVEGPNAAPASGRLGGMRNCPQNGVDVFKRFNSSAVFEDNVQSYSTVEPAIDLTASSPLAFSWQVATPHAFP